MDIVYRKIKDLIEPDYSPSEITKKEFNDLVTSMESFGIVEPAVINMKGSRKNIIIGGSNRVKAADFLGHAEYPCMEVKLAKKHERELSMRLNKHRGSFDGEKLLTEFLPGELLDSGFDQAELDHISRSINKTPSLTIAKPSYLYTLVFDSPEMLDRFKTALGKITQQVKRTEQTTDLLYLLYNDKK